MPQNLGDDQKDLTLTPSKYILAKYRIQVIDPQIILETPVDLGEFKCEPSQYHYHPGPRAIEYKPASDDLCSRSCWLKLLWCLCGFPCSLIQDCFFGCLDCCSNGISSMLTSLEEDYTFENCKCCVKFDAN